MTGGEHLLYLGLGTREESFDRAVATVPDPTTQAALTRRLHRPRSEPDPLNPAVNVNPNDHGVNVADGEGSQIFERSRLHSHPTAATNSRYSTHNHHDAAP